MNSSLGKFLRHHQRVLDCVMLTLSAVSGYYTYLGGALVLDAAGGGWQNRASAAVFALGVSVLIFGFWRMALSVVPYLPTGRSRAAGMSITSLGCIFLVAVSSWLNVTALAGAGALEEHMNRSLAGYEEAVVSIYAQARRIEEIAPEIDAEADAKQRVADEERREGTWTGGGGPGAVSNTLAEASGLLRGMAKQIREAMPRLEALALRARALLKDMRAIASDSKPVHERLDLFGAKASELAAVLAELESQDIGESIRRQLLALPDNVTRRAVLSRNPEVAAAQKAALAMIRDDLAKTSTALAEAAGQSTGLAAAAAPAFERPNVVKAVFSYADAFVPYWGGGIGLDLFPTLLILFLSLVVAMREKRSEAPACLGAITVQDLLDAFDAIQLLRRPKPRDDGVDDEEEDA